MRRYKLFSYVALMIMVSLSLFSVAQASTPSAAPSVAVVQASAPVVRSSRAEATRKIDADLLAQMSRDDARVSAIIALSEQANVNNEISPSRWAEKGWYVYNQLTATATRTQANLLNEIGKLEASGQVTKKRSFWISNSVVVEGSAAAIWQLAERSDVARLRLNGRHFQAEQSTESKTPLNSPNTLTYGVQMIKADQVWATGNRGANIVVGSLDSGVNGTHIALASKWRGAASGTLPGPDYNWKNVVPAGDNDNPTDYDPANNHGTHTTGTMVGDDGAGNQIGVAPDAKWIACDAIANGTSDADLLACFQWFLAPTKVDGTVPRPDLRPQVINNSWTFGGVGTCDLSLINELRAWTAAGIYPAWSGGNLNHETQGQNASPNNYHETKETGAISSNGNIADFSSSGPSVCTGELHPLVVAPGVSVRSARGTSTYASISGTSMASPHHAGTVALMLHTNPALSITDTINILTQTATFSSTYANPPAPYSSTRPNNLYGWGLINAEYAVRVAGGAPLNTPAATATATLSATATPTATATLSATATPTATASPTATAILSATASPTATATLSASRTPASCTISFTDVLTNNIFYDDIQYLACRGIVNGANGLFRPNDSTKRGEFAKIAVLGFSIASFTPVTPTFNDVPSSNIFYGFIEAAAHAGVVNGLNAAQCAALGTPGTCYGPNVLISRVQVAVIVQRAKGYPLATPTTPTFTDVPVGAFGFQAIETLAARSIINGAACVAPQVGLCFRPNDNIRRGELSKVVHRAIESNNATATVTATAAAATSTVTGTVVAATNTATAAAATATPTRTATATGPVQVGVANFAFSPAVITITTGTTVQWTNTAGFHNVHSLTGPESFSSTTAAAPWVYTHTFTIAGDYTYQCDIHPGSMQGVVHVVGADLAARPAAVDHGKADLKAKMPDMDMSR